MTDWQASVDKAAHDLVSLAEKHRYTGEQLALLGDRLTSMFQPETENEQLLVFAIKSILDAMAEGEAKIADSLEEEVAC
jgi:hypothetical protein